MKPGYRIASLLLCLLLAAGCAVPTPPATASSVSAPSPVTVELAPQAQLTPEQHLDLLLGGGALGKSWASVDELDPDAVLGYYTALSRIDERLPMPDTTTPKNPKYDDYSLMYAAPIEQMATLYFGMPAEQLRKSQYYLPEQNCYELSGLGSVASCLVRDVKEDDTKTIIQFEIFWDGDPYADCELTIDKSSDGSRCYKSFVLDKPDVTEEQREQWLPVLSLLQRGGILTYSWESGNDIPAHCYPSLYLFTLLRDHPDKAPTDADTLVIPEKEFEALMQQQFEVNPEHMRTTPHYDKATASYQISGGVGSGGLMRLNSVTEQDGSILLGYRIYSMADDPAWEGTLTVKQEGDSLRYLRNTVIPLQ